MPETYPEYYTKQWRAAWEGQADAGIRPGPGGDHLPATKQYPARALPTPPDSGELLLLKAQLQNDLALADTNISFFEASGRRAPEPLYARRAGLQALIQASDQSSSGQVAASTSAHTAPETQKRLTALNSIIRIHETEWGAAPQELYAELTQMQAEIQASDQSSSGQVAASTSAHTVSETLNQAVTSSSIPQAEPRGGANKWPAEGARGEESASKTPHSSMSTFSVAQTNPLAITSSPASLQTNPVTAAIQKIQGSKGLVTSLNDLATNDQIQVVLHEMEEHSVESKAEYIDSLEYNKRFYILKTAFNTYQRDSIWPHLSEKTRSFYDNKRNKPTSIHTTQSSQASAASLLSKQVEAVRDTIKGILEGVPISIAIQEEEDKRVKIENALREFKDNWQIKLYLEILTPLARYLVLEFAIPAERRNALMPLIGKTRRDNFEKRRAAALQRKSTDIPPQETFATPSWTASQQTAFDAGLAAMSWTDIPLQETFATSSWTASQQTASNPMSSTNFLTVSVTQNTASTAGGDDRAATSQADIPQPGTLAAEIGRILGSLSLVTILTGREYLDKKKDLKAELDKKKYTDQEVADYIKSLNDEKKQRYIIYNGLYQERKRTVWNRLPPKIQKAYAAHHPVPRQAALTLQPPGSLAAEIGKIQGTSLISSVMNNQVLKRGKIIKLLHDPKYSNKDRGDYINLLDENGQYYVLLEGFKRTNKLADVWFFLAPKAQNSWTKRGEKAPMFSSTPQTVPAGKGKKRAIDDRAEETGRPYKLIKMTDTMAPVAPVAMASTTPQPPAAALSMPLATVSTASHVAPRAFPTRLQIPPSVMPTRKFPISTAHSGNDADRFHQHFVNEHSVFSGSIQGITDEEGKPVLDDRERYALLTMNRLVFLAFLQKKGFLNGDRTYLQKYLSRVQDGPSYQAFLFNLFHDGLNQSARSPEFARWLGKVPYLKIDLFDQHPLERKYQGIQIPNRAYDRLLDFFGKYHWQLDDSEALGRDDITPETFSMTLQHLVTEKEKAAYYTKQDITEYISKNAIIPFLFEELQKRHPEAFSPNSPVWSLLSKDFSGTKEHIAGIEDLITSNLDSRTFAERFIVTCDQPEILLTFYQSLAAITILDPTCGTGAFLFAASNILAPLYEASLIRMQDMVHAYSGMSQEPPEIAHFRVLFQQVENAPSRQYFILKSILSHNLYGVDLMPEAVEVCKLCLNLKLLAQVEKPEELREVSFSSAPSGSHVNVHEGNVLLHYDWSGRFPHVRRNGGFSVIVGNPPYAEYNEKKFSYTIPNTFETLKCGDIYPCVVELSRKLLSREGYMGMIIPLAAFATQTKLPFLDWFYHSFPRSWLSFYPYYPNKLFDGAKGAHIATAIFLVKITGPEQRFSTNLMKWAAHERAQLFSRLKYCQVTIDHQTENRYYPKFGRQIENTIMGKIVGHPPVQDYLGERISNDNTMWYRNTGGPNWKVFLNYRWPCKSSTNEEIYFLPKYDRDVFIALFNSSLFWWYCTTTFDVARHMSPYMISGFRFSYPQDDTIIQALRSYAQCLMRDFRAKEEYGTYRDKIIYKVYARKSKKIMDEIDRILASHYGLTEKELNFIANYDLEYRMGNAFEGEVKLSLHPKRRNEEDLSRVRPQKRTKTISSTVSTASVPTRREVPTPYPSSFPSTVSTASVGNYLHVVPSLNNYLSANNEILEYLSTSRQQQAEAPTAASSSRSHVPSPAVRTAPSSRSDAPAPTPITPQQTQSRQSAYNARGVIRPTASRSNAAKDYRGMSLDYAVADICKKNNTTISRVLHNGNARIKLQDVLADRSKEEIITFVEKLKDTNCYPILCHGVGMERANNEILPGLSAEMQKEFTDRHQKRKDALKRYRDSRSGNATSSTTPQKMSLGGQPSSAVPSSATTVPQTSTTIASQPRGPLGSGAQIAPLQTYTGLQGHYHTVLAELHTQETRFYNTMASFERGLMAESSANEEREMFRATQARALAAWYRMGTFAQQYPHAGIPIPNMPSILIRKI